MAEIASFGVNVDQNTRLAQNAQDTANTANGGVNNINDPNKLAPTEKATLKRKYDTDVLLYGMDTKKLTDNQLSTSEIDSAMNALTAYMTPFFANMTTTDTVDRDTLNTVYKNFDTADKNADSAFTNMVSSAASDAMVAGNQASVAGSEAIVAGNQASEAANNAAAQASVAVSNANVAQSSVATAITKAGFANDTASTASQAANDAKTIASQAANNVAIAKNDAANALTSALNAQSNASSAVATANSTASEFGKVSQKTDNALASALNAQSDASDAVKQASSAATDSKDAKQIAGAVSQSYKTLTDGSTMTIAELESGLAAKLTKTDLDGYATQTWSQNQIKMTADGINGTVSSVQNTVNGHTTDINNLQADSRGFKAQFDTVNDTLGKHTTDIGTLQASSKELSSNFSSLNTDNNTNKNDISELKQTSSELSSTMETVQTQVQNSAVGTNLLLKTGTAFSMTGNNKVNQVGSAYSLANRYNVSSLASALGTQFTLSFDWSVAGDSPSGKFFPQWNNVPWSMDLAVTVSSSNASGHVSHTFSVSTDSKNVGNGLDIRLDNFVGTITISNVKLEKGSLATDWCPNPADIATQSQITQLSGEITQKVSNGDFSTYKTQTANLIASKVSKDTYDALAGTVSKNSTLSKQNQNALVNKADSQTVNLLTKRVSTAENTLTQTATKTALEQTKTDVDNINKTVQTNASNISAQAGKINGLLSTTSKLGDQYTTLSGQFNLSSKQLTTTMSKVDGMASGGGRNLILNSKALGYNYGVNAHATVTIEDYDATTKMYHIVAAKGSGGMAGIYFFDPLLDVGQKWAFSVDIKGVGLVDKFMLESSSNTNTSEFSLTNDWVRYSNTGIAEANPDGNRNGWVIYFDANQGAVDAYVKLPQIETGIVAHDWSPAPEDQATVTALTQVKQTAEGAQALATNNQGDITNLQATAKGLQTSVSNAATKDQLNILSDTFSNKISSATSAANSKMIQTINNVGIGFKNPDGSKFQMNLSADGTALLDFSKIMLNGQTNIQAATIGNAQIANGAINQAKIANAAIGSAQIADLAVTNAKIGNVDAGKITTGIMDASHLNVDDVIANVINGKTITGITINTPTLNLGDNGMLTGTYSVADSTSYFQPINGTGKLDISHGYIQSTANLIYYNKIMRGMANSWGYWKDSVTFVPEAHLTIGNTAESTLTAGFLKLDIFDQAKTHVVSRSYLDGTGLYINSGGTEAVSSMLSDFELLSSGRAYLMGGVNVPKSEIITIGNLQINGYHTIASNDGRDVYFKKASPKGSAPVGIHAKSFTKYSQLSIKTDISDLPADEATRMLNNIDVEKYRYTSDGATYKYQYGAVIDDINELGNKQYSLPAELLSEDGTGINLDSMTGILIKTVQDQNKKIGELSMRLTRLETA